MEWRSGDVIKSVNDNFDDRLKQACMLTQAHIRTEMQRKGRSGRTYKKPGRSTMHVASEAGQYPATVHGMAGLLGAIVWVVKRKPMGGSEGRIGVREDAPPAPGETRKPIEYALALELGAPSRGLAPRPYLRQSLKDLKWKLRKILLGAFSAREGWK